MSCVRVFPIEIESIRYILYIDNVENGFWILDRLEEITTYCEMLNIFFDSSNSKLIYTRYVSMKNIAKLCFLVCI